MKWFRKLFKRKSGWQVGESYTFTVPKGSWHVSQKVSIKRGKTKISPPVIIQSGKEKK